MRSSTGDRVNVTAGGINVVGQGNSQGHSHGHVSIRPGRVDVRDSYSNRSVTTSSNVHSVHRGDVSRNRIRVRGSRYDNSRHDPNIHTRGRQVTVISGGVVKETASESNQPSRYRNVKPEACLPRVTFTDYFDPAQHRYSNVIVDRNSAVINPVDYETSGSMHIQKSLSINSTGDLLIGQDLILSGELNLNSTGNVKVKGNLVLDGNVNLNSTGGLIVEGLIFRTNYGRISVNSTGDIDGNIRRIDHIAQLNCR